MRARSGVLMVLFLCAVGAILGSVPGWGTCFLVWLVLSWLMMAGLAIGACGLVTLILSRMKS